jgi:hypothetical protein
MDLYAHFRFLIWRPTARALFAIGLGHADVDQIIDLLRGRTGPAQSQRIACHCLTCPRCRQTFRVLRAFRDYSQHQADGGLTPSEL